MSTGPPERPKRKPFLPPLPEHSLTGQFARYHGRPRRRKLISRTMWAFILRWRYILGAATAMGLIVALIASGMVLLRDAGLNEDRAPSAAAPTLQELNDSIAKAKRYISALYKPLDGGMAVQSEASGVPLRAYFPTENKWVLLGEEVKECSTGNNGCKTTTSINPQSTGKDKESYAVSFSTQTKRDAFTVSIDIDWRSQPDQFRIETRPLAVVEPVELWLDTTKLAAYTPEDYQKSSRMFPTSNQAVLRMLRYTVRHATQEAYLYWNTYGHDRAKAAALAKFLQQNRYTPGYDMRAPLFDASSKLSDELPFDPGAYSDCDHLPEPDWSAYAYHSKVCLFRDTYLNIGARDPFLQAWQALTTLVKYKNPKHEIPGSSFWEQGGTPADIARHLQGQWNRSGKGIPKCTPLSCNELSGIRTSVFGALQTQLGYRYGNTASQRYADAAATMTVKMQVPVNGKLVMEKGTFYRPAHAGAYLASWDDKGRFMTPSTPKMVVWAALTVSGSELTPIEYAGIIPSNSETSLDALSFLSMYRCQKYKVCG